MDESTRCVLFATQHRVHITVTVAGSAVAPGGALRLVPEVDSIGQGSASSEKEKRGERAERRKEEVEEERVSRANGMPACSCRRY